MAFVPFTKQPGKGEPKPARGKTRDVVPGIAGKGKGKKIPPKRG